MAALIAFYSRAGENYFGGTYRRISVGNTEKVAEMLADLTGGELYKIEQAEPYSDDYKTCVAQAREDWQKNARPAVLNLPDDLDAYDEIYLGYPNYCSTMPMAVYLPRALRLHGQDHPPLLHARGQRPFRYRKRHPQGCPWRGGHEGPRHPRQPRGRGEERACPVG